MKVKLLNTKPSTRAFVALLLMATTFTACKKDGTIEPIAEKPKPTIENIELGLGDAGLAVINEDFHFNADIVAADKLDKVEIRIVQRSTETYSKPWEHAIVWAQYRGLKNTNVHKHFTIPKDAVEGKYDFIISIFDQDGSKQEVKRDFGIYTSTSLPVVPTITTFLIQRNGDAVYDQHGMAADPKDIFVKDDVIDALGTVSFVKDDGIMYMLLIKQSANHNPKTVEEIDFNKAVVLEIYEHKKMSANGNFINVEVDYTTTPFTLSKSPGSLKIGSEKDNRLPTANTISGSKAWETGTYNFVMIYKNATHNKTVHKSVPIKIKF
jgi:hypothetical protein